MLILKPVLCLYKTSESLFYYTKFNSIDDCNICSCKLSVGDYIKWGFLIRLTLYRAKLAIFSQQIIYSKQYFFTLKNQQKPRKKAHLFGSWVNFGKSIIKETKI